MRRLNRKTREGLAVGGIVGVSMIGLMVLLMIFGFVFANGASLLTWDFLTGDYHETIYNTYYDGPVGEKVFERPDSLGTGDWFSEKWGIAFSDETDQEGNAVIRIVYVDPESVLASLPDKNTEGETVSIVSGMNLEKVIFNGNVILTASAGAETAALRFDQAVSIKDMITSTPGGGIRGSILTTILLILLTLAFALPFGILTAVYLHEFAPRGSKVVLILRRLIEMLSGMPSIVFGLMGAAVFIPFTSTLTAADGGNLLSGALTLAVIVLPLIISTTEEALSTVPDDFRAASLALGANKTQTTFKVVIRSATPGILAGALLSVGRIIGESAALIYAVGTAIKDEIFLTERSTSLAVHIWSVMSGEVPNFEMATGISLIILLVVLFLSLLVKLIVRKFSVDPSLR